MLLTYSNRTEKLLEALVEALGQERRRASPLEPARLVVPNRHVEAWLRLGLARATGIAANLEVVQLRRLAGDLVERAAPGARLLDARRIEGLLLALLHDRALVDEPDLDEVRRYLQAGGEKPDAIDLRRCQLAHRLAVIFDEYALSRPELLDGWRRGRRAFADDDADSAAAASIERWQARLWRALAERIARLGGGERWLPFSDGLRAIAEARPALPPSLHVFGFSYVARAFLDLFALLGRRTELHLYSPNPCAELWEDPADDEPEPLRLWGRPGREHVRLLNELSDCDFQTRFADPGEPDSLLRRLQRDLLHRVRRERPEAPLAARDESVQLLACPSVRREAEVIAAEIWRLCRELPDLRLNQIAVVLPAADKGLYQTHLQAAFRELRELPHVVVDLPLPAESRIAEAIDLLLALPLGELKRSELLRLLVHPSVIGRFPEATREEWIAWCARLGIVHGADHADHEGTYIERDVLNWDQGLKRLALGAFLSGARSGGGARAFALGGEEYLPEELDDGRLGSAGAFAMTARALIADARAARSSLRPLGEWLRFFRRQIAERLAPEGDADVRALNRAREALAGLDEVDRALAGQPVSYRVACELARGALSGLQGSRGQWLADGVVVASMLPMRALPFRVVFAVGLGEGHFPSGAEPDPLDLRAARRRPGDVSPREQDRYLFLETLLGARDRLYLSYVDRAPLTGDKLAPSSVVVELLEVLKRGYLGEGEKRLTRRFPLWRHEDAHTKSASEAAAREADAATLGQAVRAHLGGPAPDPDELLATLPPRRAAEVAARLGLWAPPPPAIEPAAEARAVSLSALRRFLECPLQASARTLYGLRDDEEEDALDVEDEPFVTAKLPRLMRLRRLFVEAARAGALDDAALARAYDRMRRQGELEAVMPTGPFGEAERALHLQVLRGWRDQVLALGEGARLEELRFGAAEEDAPAYTARDPLRLALALGGNIVELKVTGRAGPILGESSLWLTHHATPTGDEKRIRNRKESLRGFFDHLALAAAGTPGTDGWAARVANVDRKGEPGLHTTRFRPIAPDEARAYLSALAAELLSGPHPYLLPCEAAFAGLDGGEIGAAVEKLAASDNKFSSTFGPVPNPRDYPPPPEAEARAMVERRFGLYRRLVIE